MKVIIDRQTWYRGKTAAASSLLTSDGTRCCMGFYAKACGISDNDQLCVRTLEELNVSEHYHFSTWNSLQTDRAYRINDTPDITDEVREQKLIELGRLHDVEFEFIN